MALSLEQIRSIADRVAASQGLDLVEIEYLGGKKHRVLRVFIEKNREERERHAQEAQRLANSVESGHGNSLPGRGVAGSGALDQLAWVTHEDCERFSRDFGVLLDVEDLVPGGDYVLEVSSPGLDRKLSARADYERFRGSLIKVQTFAPLAGNRHWQGTLTEVKDGLIVLDLTAAGKRASKKGTMPATIEIALDNVEKANLVPAF